MEKESFEANEAGEIRGDRFKLGMRSIKKESIRPLKLHEHVLSSVVLQGVETFTNLQQQWKQETGSRRKNKAVGEI